MSLTASLLHHRLLRVTRADRSARGAACGPFRGSAVVVLDNNDRLGTDRKNVNHLPTSPLRQIAVVGTHLPRRCGIATFTADICEALATQLPNTNVFALAINDGDENYAYPDRVRFEIAEQDIASY